MIPFCLSFGFGSVFFFLFFLFVCLFVWKPEDWLWIDVISEERQMKDFRSVPLRAC